MTEFKNFVTVTEAVDDYLPKLFSRLRDDPRLAEPDLWFHFTDIPKLGVNPRPSHRDPYGIYMFPKRWVVGQGLGKNSAFFTKPYVYILKIKPNAHILNLAHITRDDAVRVLTAMGLADQIPTLDAPSRYGGTEPGQILWQIIDQHISPDRGRNGAWNALFRKAGYDGVLDPGTAAIHSNEPDQAVVFSPSHLDIVELIPLKPENSQRSLVVKVLGRTASELFDGGKYQLRATQSRRTERLYEAHGTYKGHPFVVYLNVYNEDGQMREHRGVIRIAPEWRTAEYRTTDFPFTVPYRETEYEKSFDTQFPAIVAQFLKFMDNLVDDADQNKVDPSGKLHEISGQVCHYFGIKPPAVKPNQHHLSVHRQYDWGSFKIDVYQDQQFNKSASWKSLLQIYTTGRGEKGQTWTDNWGKNMTSVIHGEDLNYPDTMPVDQMAKKMVLDMLDGVEKNIYKYHNPDPTSYGNPNDYTRYDSARRGENLLKVLYRIKAIPRIRLIVRHPTNPDEFQLVNIRQRHKLDFTRWYADFQKRFPKLAALKVKADYNENVTTLRAYDYRAAVGVGDKFFDMDDHEKNYNLGRMIFLTSIQNHIVDGFVSQYIDINQPFPFEGHDLDEALATASAHYFILHDNLSNHPQWLKAVQSVYMKCLSYVKG